MRAHLGILAEGASWAPGEPEVWLAEAEADLAATHVYRVGSQELTMLAEMIVYGESGAFLNKVRMQRLILGLRRVWRGCRV